LLTVEFDLAKIFATMTAFGMFANIYKF